MVNSYHVAPARCAAKKRRLVLVYLLRPGGKPPKLFGRKIGSEFHR